MDKRYRLYVNNEWITSSDDWEYICKAAEGYWYMDDEDASYYGYYPEVRIYDTQEKCFC